VADERANEVKSKLSVHEKEMAEVADKFKRELRKEREAWVASEKVRKDKWEQEKIREIREGTVQKLEPTIQGLIEKHKEELRRTEERTSGEVRRLRE
jgi:5-azacytidine-induced protein 1